MPNTVMVVDDDPTQRRLLQAMIERQGFKSLLAKDGFNAMDQLSKKQKCCADVILLDMNMPGMSGMETLEQIRSTRPELPVIVLTASGGIETVVKSMQAGAVDFFVKPASPERIAVSIRNALKMGSLNSTVRRLKRQHKGMLKFEDMIASASSMQPVVKQGMRAAKSSIPVLILGESGVGKEILAQAIHSESDRSDQPLITVNCGAIPENLVESTLFGHEKGAFTGASEKFKGKFQEADGGTLFLDEIGELPLDLQVKLLRALQEGEVDPVGAKKPVSVDVRIISATNKNLDRQVADGDFREDLFYRLNVFSINLPPLRARAEDIPELVSHFVTRFNAEEGREVEEPHPELMDQLCRFHWPGNIRQLENAVFRAVVMAEDNVITGDDFPQILDKIGKNPPDLVNNSRDEQTQSKLSTGQLSVFDEKGRLRRLADIERDLIRIALNQHDGATESAAQDLGLATEEFEEKMKTHKLSF